MSETIVNNVLNIYGVWKRVGGGVDHSGMEDMEICVMIFKLCQRRGICSE